MDEFKLKQVTSLCLASRNLPSLLMLLPLLFGAIGHAVLADDLGLAEVENGPPETSGHIKESAEFQAINSYLTDLKPLTTNNAAVVPHLNNAIDKLESSDLVQLKSEQDSSDFKVLLENDPQITLSILRNFVSASKSCEQSELNFLVMVTEQQTFKGQFLNKYARSLLEQCWTFNLSSLSQRIDRSIGKLNSAVFDFLAELANQVSNRRTKEQRASAGTLTISDQSPPNDPAASLQQLKQVAFEPQNQLRLVALSLNSMFSNRSEQDETGNRVKIPKREELAKLNEFYRVSLLAPCEQVTERIKSAFSLLTNYNILPTGTRNSMIASKRAGDPILDYHFEIYRICRQVRTNSNNLWNLLSKMR